MGAFAGGGYQQADQNAKSLSGLKGTQYEGPSADLAYNTSVNLNNIARRGYEQPFNSQGQTQYMGFTGNQMLPGGQFGLGTNADAGVLELARRMFGFTSANFGSRGFNSPENTQGVVGSAITAALPQLIPAMQSWQQSQFQAPLVVGQYALNQAQAPAQQAGANVGSSSQSSGNSWGFNLYGGESK